MAKCGGKFLRKYKKFRPHYPATARGFYLHDCINSK